MVVLRVESQFGCLEVGFSFLMNASGRLFNGRTTSLRDVESNTEAIFAVMMISQGSGRFSGQLLAHSIIKFYEDCGLFPDGVSSSMGVIQDWGLRQGNALQRLAPLMFIIALLFGGKHMG